MKPEYTIAPSPLSADEQLVVIPGAGPEHTRARILAISFGGRLIPAMKAYALMTSKVPRFEAFYRAGVSARRVYRRGPSWGYRFPGEKQDLNIYKAAERVKEQHEPAPAQ